MRAPFGFRACEVTLIGSNGQAGETIPAIAAAPGTVIPDPEQYAQLELNFKSLAGILKQSQLSSDLATRAEAALSAALAIAPKDETILRSGADLYRRTGNNAKLATTLGSLSEIAPQDAGLFTELGHVRFRMQDWDNAERALRRARELKPGDPAGAEELARIRLTHQDDRAALAFLEESLPARADNQQLWLLRADVSQRLGDWQRTADRSNTRVVSRK